MDNKYNDPSECSPKAKAFWSFIGKIIKSLVGLIFTFLNSLRSHSNTSTSEQNWEAQNTRKQTAEQKIEQHRLNIVKNNRYQSRLVLNREEQPYYWELVKFCRSHRFVLLAQVNLGEMLNSKNENAFMSINSKRVDFCITDQKFNPIAAIEYQGSGHYNSTSEYRDQMKRHACESAGIVYIELFKGDKGQVSTIIENQLFEKTQ